MLSSQKVAKPMRPRTERILNRCFSQKTLSGQPAHLPMKQVTFGPLYKRPPSRPLVTCHQSAPTPDILPTFADHPTQQSQSQSRELKLFSNRELMNQILHSNRDKQMLERVDNKLIAFQNTLTEVREELEGKDFEKIFTECIRREFSCRFFKLNETLKKAEEENQLLKEEIARLRMKMVTVKDLGDQQNKWLNELKQEMTNTLANVRAINSDNQSLNRLSRAVGRIESHLLTNDDNDWFDQSDSEDNESIDWFDEI